MSLFDLALWGDAVHGGRWVEHEVAALDEFATIPSDVLAARVRAQGRCLEPVPHRMPPPDPPSSATSADRWLAAWLCVGCPVRGECLEAELRDAGAATTGVWGGLGDDDRRSLLALWQSHPDRGAYAVHPEQEGDQR